MKPRADDAGPPVPPDRRRSWTAEVEWRETPDGARFVIVASPAGSSGLAATIAASPPLTWPPTDSQSVQALGDAADSLQEVVLSAGWTPLAPGRAWYAKRFAWEPTTLPASGAPASLAPAPALFAPKPRWPEATAGRWRCEIDWSAGWSKSCFRALAYPPGKRRGRAIKTSRRLRWLLMAQPDAAREDHRLELDTLAAALTAGGWEPVGTGADWYAQRFSWPGDDAPADSPPAPAGEEDVTDPPTDAYGSVVSPSEDELERLLRSTTPKPRAGYVQELERSLHLRARRQAPAQLRLAFAGVGLAAALAALVLVAAVVGVLPGSSGSPSGAQARPKCRSVVVQRRSRQAYFVTDRQGKIDVRYRIVLAPRVVKRCR